MYLIVGLGNIGNQYEKNRHNYGFLVIDEILKKYSTSKLNNKFSSYFTKIELENKDIFIQKPTTFMNLSGRAIQQLSSFYKINNNNIYVLYDDLDVNLGKIKIKNGGSSGGHNGIKSIDESIGREYNRVRLGISRPQNDSINSYVLKDFKKDELIAVQYVSEYIANNLNSLIDKEPQKFLNDFFLNSNF